MVWRLWPCFMCIFLTVYKHTEIKSTMEDTQLLKEAYEDIVKRKGNDWKNFLDEGSDFLTEKPHRHTI